MKLLAAILILAAATLAHAAPPLALTSYYTNAVIISATNENTGTTGLATGVVYVAFRVSELANTEYTAALLTNDVRPWIARQVDYLQERIAAQPSSNRFTTFTVSPRTATYSGASSRTLFRGISEQQTISVTPAYGAQ